MRTNRFTVIIPTWNRSDTLEWSLRSCVHQDYDNFEIVVSDNFSNDETREVVGRLADKRVRYVRPDRHLSVRGNFEFALSHVKSGYVMYLGDDDALLPNALSELNELLSTYDADAVNWPYAAYFWPDSLNEWARNMLEFPFRSPFSPRRTKVIRRRSKDIIGAVLEGKDYYGFLPSLYDVGFVKYETILKTRGSNGRVFQSLNPDVYSAIAVACVLDSYLYTPRPYSLVGASRHSTGQSAFGTREERKVVNGFLAESDVDFHRRLVYAPSIPIAIAEAFFQARDYLPAARCYTLDIRKVLSAAIKRAAESTPQLYDEVVQAVKEISRLHGIEDGFITSLLSRHSPIRQYPSLKFVTGVNPVRRSVRIDCAPFGIRNVYEASILLGHLLVLEENGYYASIGGMVRSFLAHMRREIRKRGIALRGG